MTAPADQQFIVEETESGQRLDRVITNRLAGTSRGQVQRQIEQGAASIDGQQCQVAHTVLRAGQVVILHIEDRPAVTPTTWDAVRIVAETPEFLIVEKPAGLLTHATPSSNELTLADWLVKRYPELSNVGEDPARPGIVHRLDRDVSGILVVPRTAEAFTYFKQQFAERHIEKTYAALVHGQVEDDGEVTLSISRSHSDRRRMAARHDATGRPARTAFRIVKQYAHHTLLAVLPETGRMHQIRVHLRAIGHPIYGDQLYRGRHQKEDPLPRPFLHATRLTFVDPAGARRTYESDLPSELQQVLDRLDGESAHR